MVVAVVQQQQQQLQREGGTGRGRTYLQCMPRYHVCLSFFPFCVLCQIKKEIKMNIFLGLREREWEEAGRVRMHLHVKSFALCAFYFPQPPLSSPLPFDTPFVDVQRKLVRNESVLGFATGLLLLLLALSPSPTACLSLGVLWFCCPFLYYFLSVFFLCCGNCGSFVQPPFLCTA